MNKRLEPNRASMMVVGECMVELSHRDEGLLNLSYAGDTYNALVYALRCYPSFQGVFYTAVGSDHFSQQMLAEFSRHGMSEKGVAISKNKNAGLYSIVNDIAGERSFDYWRDQSAARSMMSLHQAVGTVLETMDLVYFSGISLGILSDEDKYALLTMLENQKSQGALIAFDPNFRVQMWNGRSHAATWFERAYQLADIALPGLDDHHHVFGHNGPEEVVEYLNQIRCPEFIVKAGPQGMFCYLRGSLCHQQPFNPAPVQRDATAAGDSFAGVYLANRLAGKDVPQSVRAADAAARIVVQYQGAIIDRKEFDDEMRIFHETQCLHVQEPL